MAGLCSCSSSPTLNQERPTLYCIARSLPCSTSCKSCSSSVCDRSQPVDLQDTCKTMSTYSNSISQMTQGVVRVDAVQEDRQWSGYAIRVNDDGFLVTCDHLVSDVSNIRVTDVRGDVRTASVFCSSPALDLAVLVSEQLPSPLPINGQEAEEEEPGDAPLPCAQFARSPVTAAAEGSALAFDKPWPQFRCSSLEGHIACRSADSQLTLVHYNTTEDKRWSGGPIFSRTGVIFAMVTTHVDAGTVARLFQPGFMSPTYTPTAVYNSNTHSGYGVASNSIVRYLEQNGVSCVVREDKQEEEEEVNAPVRPYSGRRGELLLVVLCCRPSLLRVTRDMADCQSQDCVCLSHYMSVLMNDLFQMDETTTFLGFNTIRCLPDEGDEGGGRVEALVLFTSHVCNLADALANIRDKLTSGNISIPSDAEYHDACRKCAVEPASLQLIVLDDWLRQWKGEVGRHCGQLIDLLNMQAEGGGEMLERLAQRYVITPQECRQMQQMRSTRAGDWELRRAFVELLRYKKPLDIDVVIETMACFSRTDFAHLLAHLKATVMYQHKSAHC